MRELFDECYAPEVYLRDLGEAKCVRHAAPC